MRALASIDVSGGVSRAWANVATFVPKLAAFLVILIIGYLIAKAVEKILSKVLQRIGFDRWVERGGIKAALSRSKYDAAGILGRLVFYAIMLFVLSAAFGVFGANPISGYLSSIVAYLPKVFVAIVIIVVTSAIAAGAKNLVQSTLGGLSYGKFLATAASALIVVLGVIAALDQLQIARNVVNGVLYAALAAIAGIAIVSIGGGGIQPMRTRWQRALDTYDSEAPKVRQQVSSASPGAALQSEGGLSTPYPQGSSAASPRN